MKKRILALALALVLVLSLMACSAPAAQRTPPPSAVPSVSPSNDPVPQVDLTQNIVTYAAGLDPNEALLTANGEEIPAGIYLYWLINNLSYYVSYGLTPDLYGAMLQEQMVNTTAVYSMLDNKAAELGVPLTEDQVAEVNKSLEELMEQAKMLYGLTEEQLFSIQALGLYYQNVLETMPEPTQEELDNYVYQARHILICTAVEGTDGSVSLSTGSPALNEDGSPFTGTAAEYNAAAEAKAQAILDEILASADPEATFVELMHEHSEDGRDESGKLGAPDGYTTVLGQMVKEFEEGALALEVGGISGLVKSTYGYHIILRGAVADYTQYKDAFRENTMNSMMDSWLAEAEIVQSDALKNMNITEVYNRYVEYQTAAAQTFTANK